MAVICLLNEAKCPSLRPCPQPPSKITFCNYVHQIFAKKGEIHFEIENIFLQTKTCQKFGVLFQNIQSKSEILIYSFHLNFTRLY